jgi:hypothetical protein
MATIGWLAALGGALTIIGLLMTLNWLVWAGGLIALIFGLWAAMAK